MTAPFFIRVDSWLSDDLHCAEESATMAALQIIVDQTVATRVEDRRARSVRDTINVSTYPVALWLASNWWRLRWESTAYQDQQVDWRLSHMMTSSGSGYIWPPLVIHGDGNGVFLDMRQYRRSEIGESDLKFIETFKSYVSGSDFEFAVSDFVERVLDRLSEMQVRDTDLHKVWSVLCAERADQTLSWQRKLEATLGFDPEVGDQDLVLGLVRVATEHGEGVAEELAAAERDHAPDIASRISALLATADTWRPPVNMRGIEPVRLGEDRPYEMGYRKAMDFRAALGRGSGPLSNTDMAEIFGLNEQLLEGRQSGPIGVAERRGSADHLLLRSGGILPRRFEISRLAADMLFVANDDDWSLATRSRTARQQFQRAFAAEFLCPVLGIKAQVSRAASEDDIEEVAAAYGVTPFTVQRQMVNAGMLSSEVLGHQ